MKRIQDLWRFRRIFGINDDVLHGGAERGLQRHGVFARDF